MLHPKIKFGCSTPGAPARLAEHPRPQKGLNGYVQTGKKARPSTDLSVERLDAWRRVRRPVRQTSQALMGLNGYRR